MGDVDYTVDKEEVGLLIAYAATVLLPAYTQAVASQKADIIDRLERTANAIEKDLGIGKE